MAWFAECKRRNWPCINAYYAIYEYKKFLYDEWWNSLTDEQRDRIERNRELKRQRDREEARQALMRLGMMTAICGGGAYANPLINESYSKSMKALNELARGVLK